jgi:hypothetical protein
MSVGNGSLTYQLTLALGANGAAIANNGLSLNTIGTTIQLGNDAGLTTAKLLNNREIPMNGFALNFSGVGATATGVPTFTQDPTRVVNTPDLLFNLSTGAGHESARIVFNGNEGGDAGDIFIGRKAGAAFTNIDSRVIIGWRAGEVTGATTALGLTSVGYESGRLQTGASCTYLGSQAGHNMSSGAFSVMIGFNSGLFQDLGTNSTYVGYSTGAQVWAGRACDNNTIMGAAAGLASGAVAFTAARNTIIGSLALSSAGGGYGNDNTVVGALTVQTGGLGNANTLVGANIACTGGQANLTILGQGISCTISNVCIVGRADQHVIIGTTASPTDFGARLQVLGGLSLPMRTTAANTAFTLDVDHTIVLNAATLTITIPAAAAGNTGCIVAIVNDNASAASTFSQNYVSFTGASVNTIPANAAIWLQSDGTNWKRII